MTEPNPYQSPAPEGDYTPPRVEAMEPPVTVRYKLTRENLLAASMHVQTTSAAYASFLRKQQKTVYFLGGAIVLGSLALFTLAEPGEQWPLVGCAAGVFMMVLAFRMKVRVKENSQQLIENLLKEQPDLLDFVVTVTLKPDYIDFFDDNGRSIRYWRAVKRVASTPTHAFIYLTPNQPLTIPARAFHDEAAFEAFCDLARRLWENNRPATAPGADATGSIS